MRLNIALLIPLLLFTACAATHQAYFTTGDMSEEMYKAARTNELASTPMFKNREAAKKAAEYDSRCNSAFK